MGRLLGMWNESREELTITRPNGQNYKVRNASILAGSQRVFGVETIGNEVHVLTGPSNNPQPNRRLKFNDSGMYLGSFSL